MLKHIIVPFISPEMEVEEIMKDLKLMLRSSKVLLKAVVIPLNNSPLVFHPHLTPQGYPQDSHHIIHPGQEPLHLLPPPPRHLNHHQLLHHSQLHP